MLTSCLPHCTRPLSHPILRVGQAIIAFRFSSEAFDNKTVTGTTLSTLILEREREEEQERDEELERATIAARSVRGSLASLTKGKGRGTGGPQDVGLIAAGAGAGEGQMGPDGEDVPSVVDDW